MKKSFASLITIILLAISATLLVSIFELKALKIENSKNEYLQIQASLHLDFLTSYAKSITDDTIDTLEFEDENFRFEVKFFTNEIELFVTSLKYNISLHKKIIR